MRPVPLRIVSGSSHVNAPTFTGWFDPPFPSVIDDQPFVICASSASVSDKVPAWPVPIPKLVLPDVVITNAPPALVKAAFSARLPSVCKVKLLLPKFCAPATVITPDPLRIVTVSSHVNAPTFTG